MAYIIGIDGGGTKTALVLTDENFKVLCKSTTSRTNPLVVGVDESAEALQGLIKTVILLKKVSSVDAAVLGLAGCGRQKTAEAVKKKLSYLIKKEKISVKRIFVLSDAEIALEGAFPNDNGAILIAGTGSIIYGKDKKGKYYRAGGFGKIIGDEGSGYSIGLAGLNAVAREIDKRGGITALTKTLEKQFGLKDRDSLITKINSKKFDIASIAGLVIQTAGRGDIVCSQILENESDELIHLVKSLKKKMSVRKLKLSLLGGLLLTNNFYSTLVKSKIENYCSGVSITEPIFSPEIGAALIAKRKYNLK